MWIKILLIYFCITIRCLRTTTNDGALAALKHMIGLLLNSEKNFTRIFKKHFQAQQKSAQLIRAKIGKAHQTKMSHQSRMEALNRNRLALEHWSLK